MVQLGVNIDHVATLRQARQGTDPDPLLAALACQIAGADSIVAHLREDRRHIQERDIFLIKQAVKIKFNLEMSIAEEIVNIACRLKPQQTTLVPEKRQELTTEGGLDIITYSARLKKVIEKLKKQNIAVSLFIDPDKKQIYAAKKIGVKIIELHTGNFSGAKNKKDQNQYFQKIKSAAKYASDQGFQVFAGHGLNYLNVAKILKIKEIEELNIGHAIICRAVMVGLNQAVREMKILIQQNS